MEQITASILFTSLQSLTVSLKLKEMGWENLDIVTSELVKFMLTNTAYDSIENLECTVKKLESQSLDFKSQIKGASNSASTAANKVDELKKVVAGLEKRLKKLE